MQWCLFEDTNLTCLHFFVFFSFQTKSKPKLSHKEGQQRIDWRVKYNKIPFWEAVTSTKLCSWATKKKEIENKTRVDLLLFWYLLWCWFNSLFWVCFASFVAGRERERDKRKKYVLNHFWADGNWYVRQMKIKRLKQSRQKNSLCLELKYLKYCSEFKYSFRGETNYVTSCRSNEGGWMYE